LTRKYVENYLAARTTVERHSLNIFTREQPFYIVIEGAASANPNCEGHLFTSLALGEYDIGRRSREITSGDKNDILHASYPQSKLPSECKPNIDIFEYAFSKISTSDRILTLGWHRK
jgi:hypothetical protein